MSTLGDIIRNVGRPNGEPDQPTARPWRELFRTEPVRATDLEPFLDARIPYVIWPIAVEGSLTQIQGAPKGGKSSFGLYVATCAATGTWPFPQYLCAGVDHDATEVLYISWEDPKIMMAKRLALYTSGLGLGKRFLPSKITFLFAPDIFIEQEPSLEALTACVKELGSKLVIIDTLSHIHGKEENDSSEMKIPMRKLDRFARESNVAVIYIHHTAKNSGDRALVDRGRGSSAIAAAWHILIDWGQREEDSNVNPVAIESKYEHYSIRWNVSYKALRDEFDTVHAVSWGVEPQTEEERARKSSAQERKLQKVLDTVSGLLPTNDWVSTRQIVDFCSLKVDEKSIRRYLNLLVGSNRLVCQQRGQGAGKFYQLPIIVDQNVSGNLSDNLSDNRPDSRTKSG